MFEVSKAENIIFSFVSVVSILFCVCLSGFGCGVRGVRGGQILLSIKSSSLPSCPSPRSEYLHEQKCFGQTYVHWTQFLLLTSLDYLEYLRQWKCFGHTCVLSFKLFDTAFLNYDFQILQQNNQQGNPRVQ